MLRSLCLVAAFLLGAVVADGQSIYSNGCGTTINRNHSLNYSNNHHRNNYGVRNFSQFNGNYGGFNLNRSIHVNNGFNSYGGTSGFSHSKNNLFNNRGVVLIRLSDGQYVLGEVLESRVVQLINEFTGQVDFVSLVRTRVGVLDFWVRNTNAFRNHAGFNRAVFVPFNDRDFLFSVKGNFIQRSGGFNGGY